MRNLLWFTALPLAGVFTILILLGSSLATAAGGAITVACLTTIAGPSLFYVRQGSFTISTDKEQ